MKKQRIKKALVSSALALILCVSMFIGNTFAWFTDTASTSVNTIKAGNLKVDIIGANDDTSLTGTGLSFVNKNGSKDILWEPGATFRTEGFRIANKGSLALKYQLVLTGITGDADLLNAIEFSVVKGTDSTIVALTDFTGNLTAGEVASDVLYIQGHMKETAGNEYQGKSLTGLGITVYATQDTVEYDSNDNTYDAGATIATVADETALKAAIANGAAAIILTDDIALSDNLTISNDTIIYGNGNTISGYPVWVQTESVKIYDVVFDAPANTSGNASNLYANGTNKNLVLDGCTFKNTQWDCVQITPENNSDGNIVINNCSFYADTSAPSVNPNGVQRFIHIEVSNGSACTTPVNVTLTNNFFGSTANFGYQNTTTKTYNDIIGIYGVDESYINYGGNNLFTDNTKPIWIGWSNNAYANNQDEIYAKLGKVFTNVDNATDLKSAIEDGGAVKLTDDITASAIISITKDVIIDGNGKTITAAEDKDRIFDVANTSTDISIKLSNLTLNAASAERGISLYNNTGKITLEIDNCNITANKYAVNVASNNSNIEVTVKNSNITGYCAAQTWSANSKLTFENCTLTGLNKWNGNDNDFSTIVVNQPATGSQLSFKNCNITTVENGTADETFFSVRCNSTITVDGCSFTDNGAKVNVSELANHCYFENNYTFDNTFTVK